MKVKIPSIQVAVITLPHQLEGLSDELVLKIAEFVYESAPYVASYEKALMEYQKEAVGKTPKEAQTLLSKKVLDTVSGKEVEMITPFTKDDLISLVTAKKIAPQDQVALYPFVKQEKK